MVARRLGEAVVVLGKLTDLQVRVLTALAPVQPRWTLTGGAALAGFHLQHRPTRDLDLFWHDLATFAREPEDCVSTLEAAGFKVHVLQRSRGFVRLRVEQAGQTVIVDLVAEPVPTVERPAEVAAGQATIQIDGLHEILVNKVGALLHRAEVRDLVDLKALLDRGGDLPRALRDAGTKDAGFSPMMLGYLLQSFPLAAQAAIARLDAKTTQELDRFRVDLAARVAVLTKP